MGRSRYAGTKIIDGTHFGTWKDLTTKNPFGPDILDSVETVEHILQVGERLDALAARYYGDDEYWWIIALANRIQDPFSLSIGRRLRIPRDPKSILDKIQR